jgi:hypothetical protein
MKTAAQKYSESNAEAILTYFRGVDGTFVPTPAPEPVEKLRCICGYDARNNERDHNVECFVHNPKLAAAERKEAK